MEEEERNAQAVTSNTNTAQPSDSFTNFLQSPLPELDANDIGEYLRSIERNVAPSTKNNLHGSYPIATSDMPEYPDEDIIFHTPILRSPAEATSDMPEYPDEDLIFHTPVPRSPAENSHTAPAPAPVPAETFHHVPVAAEDPLSMAVPNETFLPAREPPVTTLPAPFVTNAVQRPAQLSAPAHPQFMMHETPVPVLSSNVPTTSIITMKTSRRVNISGSSGRRTTKKPPGVPSFASLCYSAISHSSTGTLYLNEIYTWVQNNYTNFDPADIKWKNSIRNILKRNPGFRKTNKQQRYGHQYSVHPACAGAFLLGQFKIKDAEALIAAYNDKSKNSCNSPSTQHQPTPAAHQNYGHQLYSSTQHQSHQHARSHRYQPYVTTTQQQRVQSTRHI